MSINFGLFQPIMLTVVAACALTYGVDKVTNAPAAPTVADVFKKSLRFIQRMISSQMLASTLAFRNLRNPVRP
jgi:hypothetical protein